VEVLSRKGHPCTQATISRDVEELGLTKTREGHYVLAEDQHLQRMVHGLTDSVARTGNLVLIHAQGGTAPGVAGAIDLAHMDGVMGTVSGDTTVLVVCENEDKAASVEDKIRYFTNSELKI
jgi:transcriptional regulator of arginine metabolism